ncbi:MAG: OmpA family protein [Bacteroidia bacterium]
MKKALLMLLALFCIHASVLSQTAYKYGLPKGKDFDRWSVGILGGTSYFQNDLKVKGDATNSTNNAELHPLFGAHIGYQVSHSIGLSIQGLWGDFDENPGKLIYLEKIIDSVAYVNFKSPLADYTLNMTFSFGNISFIKRNTSLHFIIKAGLGLCETTPDFEYSRDGVNYMQYNEPSKVSNLVIPIGFGVRYAFGKFNIGIDYDYRKAFTDKLDAYAVPKSDYDGYSMLTAQVNYVIGKKKKQMEWVNPIDLIYSDIGEMKERVDSLTNDKDRDGVADIFDKDNTTPAGAKVYGDGTLIDTDGDGLADATDADPYSERGAKVDGTGKEIDTDGDGVPDSRDKENNTTGGTLVNFQGISIGGRGGDTININNENVTNNNGGVGFFPSVFFDVNKTDIKSIYYDRFLTVARVMKMNPDLVVKITGSTDQQGGVELNDKLGMRRAEAAKEHLVKVYGIDPARLLTVSKGKNEPLASKDSKATDYLNRRIDFIIEAGTVKK